MLADRIAQGVALYENGTSPKLLMSGDHGRADYDEVNAMREMAVQAGLPADDVFMDHAGFSTYESMYRARDVFGAKRIVIVSQKYHLYRALYVAERLGLDAYGVSADLRPYAGQEARELREVLARHAAAPLLQGVEVATPQAVAEMARARLAGSQQEECWLAMVNAGNRLVAWERLRQGNVESVPLLPRDVLEPALRYKASGIILVHNHPGGQTRPSQPDLIFTNTVRELAVNMGLRFLDHVIVTDNGCYSICQCRHL
jgi:DNA repair protein RadC